MSMPVLTVAQMRDWENASWAAGIHSIEVIARVGQKMGEWLLIHSAPEDFLIFLVGRGHNGDDARAAAEWVGWRRPQRVISIIDPEVGAREIDSELQRASTRARRIWVIDGLFGIGLNRPFGVAWCHLIDELNRQTASLRFRVVAVDVPSGLSDDAGGTAGALVRASDTLTVAAPKRGLIGLEAAGRVEVVPDVGLLEGGPQGVGVGMGVRAGDRVEGLDLRWLTDEDFAEFPPRRPVAAHKGTQGHLLLVAGSRGFHGAAVLAARAALQAAPGLVSVVCDPAAYLPIAGQLVQPMVHPWVEGFVVPDSVTAVVVGPGLASRELPPGLVQWAQSLWCDFDGPVLADASALDWVQRCGPFAGPRILTPHPGEAARFLATTTGAVQSDRVAAVSALHEASGTTAVLKGFHTLIGGPGSVLVSSTGNAGLAQGGTGDVLAGFMGGWLARRLPVDRAVTYAIWEHGQAADRLAARPVWTTEDLIAGLR